MRRATWPGILLILSLFSLQAQEPDWKRVHETTLRGLDHLYALDVDDAMAAFDSVSSMAPGDPRGPFFRAMTSFYLYGLSRKPADLERFFNESENVIDICEGLIDRNERDAVAKFYLGGILGYRGIAYSNENSLLKAVKDGRQGYFLLEEAVILDPTLYDAHMGFGLFRYLVAKVPRSMSWILNLLGFDGDLQGGLASLKLAADRGIYTRTEAALFYAQFMFSEERRDTALIYLGELRRRHPENTLFIVLYAAWQRQMNNLDEAQKAAELAIEMNARKKIRYGEELAFSTLGSIHFQKNDFGEARENYLKYMDQTQVKERTPNLTYFRAAIACDVAGDRANAVRLFGQMKKADDSDRPREVFQYRLAQKYQRRPLNPPEIMNIKAENEASNGKPERALALYRSAAAASAGFPDARARALYGIVQMTYELKQYPECVAAADSALAVTPEEEVWIPPHVLFKKGQALGRLGRPADATAAFEAISDHDDYDFQSSLERRTEDELRTLRRE
jgi:tetratricopeptide (TPR) repeat protein